MRKTSLAVFYDSAADVLTVNGVEFEGDLFRECEAAQATIRDFANRVLAMVNSPA